MRNVLLAAVLVMSGCSLVVDSDGLSGGDAPSSPGDGGTLPEGAAGDAATQETSTTGDGAMPFDAGTPCSTPHLFCDDFEDGGDDIATRWTTFNASAGPIALDTKVAHGGQRSLRVELTSGAGDRSSFIEKSIPTTKGVKLGFDILIDVAPAGSYGLLSYGALFFSPPPAGNSSQSLLIQQVPGSASFAYEADNGFPAPKNQPITLKYGSWQHVQFDLVVSSVPNKGVMRLDGMPLSTLEVGSTAVTSVDLHLGLWFTRDATTTTTVHYDNVVIDEL